MKRLLSAILASMMLFGTVPAAFAAEESSSLTLAEGSHLVLDTESGYVDKIDGTVTVADLKAEFASAITVKKGDTEKTDDKFVATDDMISSGTDSLKALIYGDVDRTGKINLTDVSGTMKHIAKWNPDVNTDAADVDKSGAVNLLDAAKLLKFIAGFEDISLGNVRLVFDNTKLTAKDESSEMQLYFESALVKLSRDNLTHTGENAYKIMSAKNETESCQFILTSTEEMEGLTLELTPFVHEYGEYTLTGEMFRHRYYKMTVPEDPFEYDPNTNPGEELFYPEILLPLADSFELHIDQAQGFTVNLTVPTDAAAGMYKATLSVKDGEGKELKRADIYAHIWDFALPDTPYSKSSFGLGSYSIYATLGMYGGDDNKTFARYYEYLLENNLSGSYLPYPITDPRADAYMSDPRVTAFKIGGYNLDHPSKDNPDQVVAEYTKIKTNPVWAEKGVFYYVDEPYGPGGAEAVRSQHEYLENLLGTDDFRVGEPFGNNMADQTNNIDMLEYLKDYVDIFVPTTHGFLPNGNYFYEKVWTPRRAFEKYGESLPRLQAIKEDPSKELWWYTCVSPQFPFPNLFVNYQGVMTRVIWWQQFMYDVDGYLYWEVTADWDDIYTKRYSEVFPTNGDGTLIYLGEKFGFSGPVPSWRLIQVRDGFDDFDMLRMAEEIYGTEEVLKVVHLLTTDVLTLDQDPAVMENCRKTVAKMILAAQEK